VHEPRRAPARSPLPRPAAPRPRRRPAASPTRGARVLSAVAALPDHPLLDRLIRGRYWIGLIACALISVVAMQIALLKINNGVGRALTHTTLLERENASLRAEVSALSDPDRVQAEAAKLGMVLVAPGGERFLAASSGLVGTALRQMSAGAGIATPLTAPSTEPTAGGSPVAASTTSTTSTATTPVAVTPVATTPTATTTSTVTTTAAPAATAAPASTTAAVTPAATTAAP
jgi:cell division protein FtsL